MLSKLFWLFLLFPSFISCTPPGQPAIVREASGVERQGDDLLVVDDSVSGAYFRVPLAGDRGPLIPLSRPGARWVTLPNATLAVDLEGVDTLADGRLVLLSERLRSLVGEEGVIAEYDNLLSEVGKRGLEGLAVRSLPGGSSRIAVLWEGGYLDTSSVPIPLRNSPAQTASRPVVVVHDLKPGENGKKVRMEEAVASTELEVPTPAGKEPQAQRFRAPDLVWYQWPDQTKEWGYLVLITSGNFAKKPEYLYHWLQRFGQNGKPIGQPLDLKSFLPSRIQGANWEGLSWFKKGQSVVLVHEAEPDLPANAFILQLPTEWQFSGDET